MAIVNFSIPKNLSDRVSEVVEEKGFASKAEFFRFAAIYFIDVVDKPIVTEDDRFEYLSKTLTKEIVKRFRGKKIPSLKKQLADI